MSRKSFPADSLPSTLDVVVGATASGGTSSGSPTVGAQGNHSQVDIPSGKLKQAKSLLLLMVVAVEDMPVIVAVLQGLVEVVVELGVLELSVQAHKHQGLMLEAMEETQQSRVHHGLMELMVIH